MGSTHDIVVERGNEFDIYRPGGAVGELPAVIFVHGPAPAGMSLRDSPFFGGYGRLLAGRGTAAVVVDVRYQGTEEWPAGAVLPPKADWAGTAAGLDAIVQRVRDDAGIDGDRVAIWAFSGGGMLTGSWLAHSPSWLRCVALTYPVLADPAPESAAPAVCDLVVPGRPVVLTRVGRERPEFQVAVDRFLTRARSVGAAVDVIDVPDGEHGFDARVPSLESCEPVLRAVADVVKYLAGS
jgi:dienelactone hydrolase